MGPLMGSHMSNQYEKKRKTKIVPIDSPQVDRHTDTTRPKTPFETKTTPRESATRALSNPLQTPIPHSCNTLPPPLEFVGLRINEHLDPKSADSQLSPDPGPQWTQEFHHEKARPEFYQSPTLTSSFPNSFHPSPALEVRKTHDNLHDFPPSAYLRKLTTHHPNDTTTNRDAPNSHTSHLTNPGRRSHLTQDTRPTAQSLLPHHDPKKKCGFADISRPRTPNDTET